MNNIFFIVSPPRSGSTLLQRILSQSELIGSTNEPWFLLPHLRHVHNVYNHSLDVEAKAINGFIKLVGEDKYMSDYRDFLLKIYAQNLSDEEIFFLDKTPRYYEFLPELVRLFPNAKIIVLHRNPVASLLSTVERWPKKYLFDYFFKYKDIIDAHLHINSFVKDGPNNNIYQINYEEITRNPDETLIKLFNYLELTWKPTYLNFQKVNKISGVLGDNKIYNTYKILNKKEIPEIEKLNSKVVQKFIRGYCNYLIENKYDLYDLGSFQPQLTPEFSRFFKFCKYMSNNGSSFSFKNNISSLKYSFYYHRYRI